MASVLDYRPSTVAAAAVLAATHGTLTKEALGSKMIHLSPSCLPEKVRLMPHPSYIKNKKNYSGLHLFASLMHMLFLMLCSGGSIRLLHQDAGRSIATGVQEQERQEIGGHRPY